MDANDAAWYPCSFPCLKTSGCKGPVPWSCTQIFIGNQYVFNNVFFTSRCNRNAHCCVTPAHICSICPQDKMGRITFLHKSVNSFRAVLLTLLGHHPTVLSTTTADAKDQNIVLSKAVYGCGLLCFRSKVTAAAPVVMYPLLIPFLEQPVCLIGLTSPYP